MNFVFQHLIFIGCEYGDKSFDCKSSVCTYDKVSTCCKTCKVNVSDPCQFGDKDPFICSSLKRYECYKNELNCCGTCRNWLDNTNKDCRYGDKLSFCEKLAKEYPAECGRHKELCCHSCRNYN